MSTRSKPPSDHKGIGPIDQVWRTAVRAECVAPDGMRFGSSQWDLENSTSACIVRASSHTPQGLRSQPHLCAPPFGPTASPVSSRITPLAATASTHTLGLSQDAPPTRRGLISDYLAQSTACSRPSPPCRPPSQHIYRRRRHNCARPYQPTRRPQPRTSCAPTHPARRGRRTNPFRPAQGHRCR